MKLIILAFGVLIGSLASSSAVFAQSALAQPAESVPPDTNSPVKRRAVPDTLMFTIDEFNEVKDRRAGGEAAIAEKSNDTAASLYLGSIMYYGPNDWTVWINGLPISPAQDFQAFQITDISPRYVELLVPLSVQGMRPVRLEPNQTFISESGIIIEGRYP